MTPDHSSAECDRDPFLGDVDVGGLVVRRFGDLRELLRGHVDLPGDGDGRAELRQDVSSRSVP